MFSSILNNLTLEFAQKQKVVKQEFESFIYNNLGGIGSGTGICYVEILTSQRGRIAVIFHERADNEGTSVTNAISKIAPEYLEGSDLARYYEEEQSPKVLRIFESYNYGKGCEISEVTFYGGFKVPNWYSLEAEEIVNWLNNEGTSLNDLQNG